MQKVTIVGLGYVGLPLARRANAAGYSTSGIDTSDNVINLLSRTETIFSQISSTYDAVKSADIIAICVPTPIYEDKSPNLTYINSALQQVGERLCKGQLVSIESTVFPGYCEAVGRDILESASGLVAGQDFYLVHCPERINPGDEEWHIGNIPRVLGGVNEKSAAIGKSFYAMITGGEIYITRNMAEAEATKMIENAFRDINIAFVNELAQSFDNTNVNLMNVINAASTKPFGYMAFRPGLGVGGHCIPVDPQYLISAARTRGFNHDLLINARKINDSMVDFVVDKITYHFSGNRIALLGLTYKPGVADLRESQAVRLRDSLLRRGYEVVSYDPLVASSADSLNAALMKADAVIIATGHSDFLDIEKIINEHESIELVFDATGLTRSELLTKAQFMGIGVS